MLKKEDPKNSKLSIGTGIAIGGLGTLFSASDYKDEINKSKNNYNKIIDKMIDNIDKSIRIYEHAISMGLKTMGNYDVYDKWKKNQKAAMSKIEDIINKMIENTNPVDIDPNTSSDKQMEKESLDFIKKVIKIPLFKTTFKDLFILDRAKDMLLCI